MPIESFQRRWEENVPGPFFVDDQCLDCDLCRAVAPGLFTRNEDLGYSYVCRQPETPEELEQAREALEDCPCEAVFSDGVQFDWSIPPQEEPPSWRKGLGEKPVCKHCDASMQKRPWWKFWT